jgi:hypothetical protein
LASLAAALTLSSVASAAVIINEVLYDDVGTDDREYVELYNNGGATEAIGDWTLGGRDPGGANSTVTITAGTMLAPGAYYVIGNAGVLNVNQVVGANSFENDNESLELRDGPVATGTLRDAVAYETNKGAAFASPTPGVAEIGPGYFGNHQAGVDVGAVAPLNGNVSVARYLDGVDTNNNGRDFGMRPSTPGSSNSAGGTMTNYAVPNPDVLAVGSDVPGMVGSFRNPKVINPTVADTNNPNAIAPPPGSTNAYTLWDTAGGGDGATTNAVYGTTASKFSIKAYLATDDLPVQTNSAGVEFKGTEITMYGIGGGDVFTNLTDLTGDVGLGAVALPAAESGNGFTGVAWIYERVGLGPGVPPSSPISEKLHLVDANDGGDSDVGGNTPLDWIILASFDLSSTPNGWHNLGIEIDAAGNGVAIYDTNVINFVTSTALHSGAFNVGYRENLQLGSDGTPDAIMRPATWTVPEPGTLALVLMGLMALAWVRRK